MDILNFISWIRGRRLVTEVNPAKTVLPVGVKDPRRDDQYIAGVITVENFVAQLAPGQVGPTGPQGPQGPQGIAGPQGNQGPIGNTGVQGVPGVQGIQGPAGAVGPAGLNWEGAWVSGTSYVVNDAVAYGGASYFCINATSGTTNPAADTANWALLASQGAVGPQGIQGLQGIQGVAGPAGIQGPIGLTGPTGAQGPIGSTGPTGATGPQGVPGPVGPAGLNWQGAWVSGDSYVVNDAVGFGGASYFCINPTSGTTDPDLDTANWALLASQGAAGVTGPTGATGATGLTGAQGPQGVPGPVGPAGLDWQGEWSASGVYAENDAVSFGGASYFCYNPAGVGPSVTDPATDTANWALLAAQGATGPQGPQGDPINGVVILAAAGAEGTSVTGTLVDTISRSVYIPANTLEENAIIEISWGVYRGTNFADLKNSVHINLSPSLVGATLIATGDTLPVGGPVYSRNIRDARINDTTIAILDVNDGSATDTVTTSERSLITIDRTLDCYILFAIRPLHIGDIGVVDRVRITQYPTTV
jgi:hypothetical protein